MQWYLPTLATYTIQVKAPSIQSCLVPSRYTVSHACFIVSITQSIHYSLLNTRKTQSPKKCVVYKEENTTSIAFFSTQDYAYKKKAVKPASPKTYMAETMFPAAAFAGMKVGEAVGVEVGLVLFVVGTVVFETTIPKSVLYNLTIHTTKFSTYHEQSWRK